MCPQDKYLKALRKKHYYLCFRDKQIMAVVVLRWPVAIKQCGSDFVYFWEDQGRKRMPEADHLVYSCTYAERQQS